MTEICPECGDSYYPHHGWGSKAIVTCGMPECQRKRKTRLQKERREALRADAATAANEAITRQIDTPYQPPNM
jgi:hypothetical protein